MKTIEIDAALRAALQDMLDLREASLRNELHPKGEIAIIKAARAALAAKPSDQQGEWHRWQPDADVEGAVYCPRCTVTRRVHGDDYPSTEGCKPSDQQGASLGGDATVKHSLTVGEPAALSRASPTGALRLNCAGGDPCDDPSGFCTDRCRRESGASPDILRMQLGQMKLAACEAHRLCYQASLANPQVQTLGDDGELHNAIHAILAVDTPLAICDAAQDGPHA